MSQAPTTVTAPAVLITGVAGFIGSHLAERLVAEGVRVIGLDNLDPFYHPAIKRRNLEAVLLSTRFRLVNGDVRDQELLAEIFQSEEIGQVYHLAAKVGVRDSANKAVENRQVNVEGTNCLLQAMVAAKVRNVVFASSSSVYGASKALPFNEAGPVDPINPYGRSKLEAEALCQKYSAEHGLNAVVCRLFTVYGPRQRPDMAIAHFVHAIKNNVPISIYEYEGSYRDYTHVFDAVSGLIVAGRELAGFNIVNIGSGVLWELPAIVQMIAAELHSEPTIEIQGANPSEMQKTLADISLACSLGYEPTWWMEKGIAEYIRWEKGRKDEV